MDRSLIVAKVVPTAEDRVAEIFAESDATELPAWSVSGTVRCTGCTISTSICWRRRRPRRARWRTTVGIRSSSGSANGCGRTSRRTCRRGARPATRWRTASTGTTPRPTCTTPPGGHSDHHRPARRAALVPVRRVRLAALPQAAAPQPGRVPGVRLARPARRAGPGGAARRPGLVHAAAGPGGTRRPDRVRRRAAVPAPARRGPRGAPAWTRRCSAAPPGWAGTRWRWR